MSQWNPSTHPYRVCCYSKSSNPLLHGWSSGVVGVFATLEEAKAVVPAPRCMRRGTLYYVITFAQNAATWSRNGSWKQVGKKYEPEPYTKSSPVFFDRNFDGGQS